MEEPVVQRQFSRASRRSKTSADGSAVVSFDSTSDSISKASKSVYSFMDKRAQYKVIEGEVDMTPDNILDNHYLMMEEPFTHAAFETRRKMSDAHLTKAKSTEENVGIKVYETTISLDDIHIDYTVDTEQGLYYDEAALEKAPSAFYLPMTKPITMYPPQLFVTLKETDTTFLFQLPSFSCEKGTLESNTVEQENEYYLYMTVGKGRNRKTICAETQTEATITQTRHTLAKRPQKKNAIAFASVWDMHDTYALQNLQKEESEDDEMVMYQSVAPNYLRKKKKTKLTKGGALTMNDLIRNPRFLDAVVLVERVLANNIYIAQQKRYRGLVPFNPLRLDLKYFYSLNLLWVFTCLEVADFPVMSVCFNPANDDLIAAAYGKFLYADMHPGVICIWCSKNPRKPERIYYFDEPATSIAFSKENPNWLACGFNNGDVLILDITSFEKKIIAKSTRDTNPCFEPIWTVTWCKSEGSQEYVMATCQDGRINRYTNTKTHDFICTPMMRVTQVEGKIRGVHKIKPCMKFDVPIIRNPAALCYARHPNRDDVYFVGTDDGCIHKCSTNYLNQHMEVFRAHVGPVYDIQFSPFWKTLMVTCGADWAIRLWIEGIDDAILTMNCTSAVYGVTWSPSNATILVTVNGNTLLIWDIRRKTFIPSAEYKFPTSTTLTYVKFGKTGENIIIGDDEGQIHTFHLEDMPISPFYQKQILEESIRKVLSTRPYLARQLEKIEKFNAK